MNINFKDFVGIPKNKGDRVFDGKNYKLVLPLKRYKNWSRDQNPLSFKKKKD